MGGGSSVFLYFMSFLRQELRATYQNADAPSKRLKGKDTSQPLSENLPNPMLAYRMNQSKRGPFNSAISSMQDVNQYELVGVLQYLLRIRPSASADQFRYSLTVLEMLQRLDVKAKFPDEFKIVQ